MRNFLIAAATIVLASFPIHADPGDLEKTTALYLIGQKGDWIGKGRERIFSPKDGTFTFTPYGGGVRCFFNLDERQEYWTIEFGGPNREELHVGVYKNAKRGPFSDFLPGLDVSSDHSGCNKLSGEFEILELSYDEGKENVVAFAANFIQRCEEVGPPLFGSIRYNSDIPVETRFKEHLGKEIEPSTVYVSKWDAATGEMASPMLLTGEGKKLELHPLPFGGEGVQIVIDGDDEKWTFDFAPPVGSKFAKGVYDASDRYPFNGYFESGVGVTSSKSAAAKPIGFFHVIDIQKDKNGNLRKLIMQFSIKTEDGYSYEGHIKHLLDLAPLETRDEWF